LVRVKSLTTALAEVARLKIGGNGIYVAQEAIGLLGLAELVHTPEQLRDTQTIKFRTVRETETHRKCSNAKNTVF
jgi:hypothetical protein